MSRFNVRFNRCKDVPVQWFSGPPVRGSRLFLFKRAVVTAGYDRFVVSVNVARYGWHAQRDDFKSGDGGLKKLRFQKGFKVREAVAILQVKCRA